jgi:bile acid-coenzyme A ligase
MGWMDKEGYLYLVDRRTDMMIVAGSNIYPAEIEAALDAHPAILSSAVVARPDPDLGSRPHAVIEVRPGQKAPTGAELLAFLTPLLANTKLPYSFEISSEQVRDSGGKVRRSALKQRLEQQLAGGRTFERLKG